jgi:hypothetical protein
VRGCGGDVANPRHPDRRLPGASAVIRMSPPVHGGSLGSVELDAVRLDNCALAGESLRAAISLGAYERIRIGSLHCDGLASDASMGAAPDIAVLAFTDHSGRCRDVTLGDVHIAGCRTPPGASAFAFVAQGQAGLERLLIGALHADASVAGVFRFDGDAPVGRFEWLGGDVSQVANAAGIIAAPTPPRSTMIVGMNGFLRTSLDFPGAVWGESNDISFEAECRGLERGDGLTITPAVVAGAELSADYAGRNRVRVTLRRTSAAPRIPAFAIRVLAQREAVTA